MPLILSLLLACGPTPSEPCPLWYTDLDGDGFGAGDGVASCAEPSGRVLEAGDCEDRDSAVHPGAIDAPLDGVDQDCDGEDRCAKRIPVYAVEDVDCDKGSYSLEGSTTRWPEGDCICHVNGSVFLNEAQAAHLAGGLLQVNGDLGLGLLTPWDGTGLESLQQVDGDLTLIVAQDTALPALEQVDGGLTLSTPTPGEVTVRLPQLTGLGGRLQVNALSAELDRLTELSRATLSEAAATLPQLTELRYIDLESSTMEIPQVDSTPDVFVLPGAASTLYGVTHLDDAKLEAAAAFPDVVQADTLRVLAPGFTAPKLQSLTELEVQDAAPELQRLEHLTLLQLQEGATLSLPRIQALSTLYLDTDSALDAPLLTSLEALTTTGPATLNTGEVHIEVANIGGAIALARLVEATHLEVSETGSLDAPALLELETLVLLGPLQAPSLEVVEGRAELQTSDALDLSSLRRVGTLYTENCQDLAALRVIESRELWVEGCQGLDLRQLSVDGPLELRGSADASVLLQDPFPQSIWQIGSLGGPLVTLETVQGAYVVTGQASVAVRQVTGDVRVTLSTEGREASFNAIQAIEAIDGDLSFCAEWNAHADYSLWLSTLHLGGSAQYCP